MPRAGTSWLARAFVGAVVVGLGVACSVDVDVSNKACPCGAGYVCDDAKNLCVLPQDLAADAAAGADAAPSCDPCPCSIDSDCKDPTRSHCSPNKVCVECAKTPDSCAVGYCNDSFECTAGCKNENDCQKISPGTHCQLKLHQCVACVDPTFPCAGGMTCSPSGACVETCSATKPCAGTQTCCQAQGLCLDTKADVLNCGGCGTACATKNGTPACTGGACTWTCASGFAHCGTTNSGCETNIRTDPTHCGSCGKSCSALNANGATCTAGACAYTTCKDFFADCNGNKADGCECSCGGKNQGCCPSGPACMNGGCNPSGKCPM